MIQSKQACDNLSEEQHLESFGNTDPEKSVTDVSSFSRNVGGTINKNIMRDIACRKRKK